MAALSTKLSTAALDKHPQSKERGITLDLGFSSFTVSGLTSRGCDGLGEHSRAGPLSGPGIVMISPRMLSGGVACHVRDGRNVVGKSSVRSKGMPLQVALPL